MPQDKQLYQDFEALFKAQYNSLANYACSILGNEHEAEDVVQEVFIKIWNTQPELARSPQAKFYLLTAVRNTSISSLRKSSARPTISTEDIQLPQTADEDHLSL
jgi:RNA polymerase sigma factor (sigma-70 family)